MRIRLSHLLHVALVLLALWIAHNGMMVTGHNADAATGKAKRVSVD